MITLKMIGSKFDEIDLFNRRTKSLQNYLNDLYEDRGIVKYESEQPGGVGVLEQHEKKIIETEKEIDSLGLNQLYGDIYTKGSLEDVELLETIVEDLGKQMNFFDSGIGSYKFVGKGKEYQFTIQEIYKALVESDSALIDAPLDKNSLRLLFDISKKIDIGTTISDFDIETYSHGLSISEVVSKFCKNQRTDTKQSFTVLYEYLLQETKECTNKIIMDMPYEDKLKKLTLELETIANKINESDKKTEYSKNLLSKIEELNREIGKYERNDEEILTMIYEEKNHPFKNRKNLKNLYQKHNDLQMEIDQIQNNLKLLENLPGVSQFYLMDSIQRNEREKNNLLREYTDKKKEYFDANVCYALKCVDRDMLLSLRKNLLYSQLCNVSYDAGNHIDTINQLELIHGYNETVINNLFYNLPIPENYSVSKIIFEKKGDMFPNDILVKVQYSNIGEHYTDSQTKIYDGKCVMDRNLLCLVDYYSERLSPVNSINHQMTREAYSAINKIEEYAKEQKEITQYTRGSVSLPEGWIWNHYDDCSGCLTSPEGVNYFSYDLATKEAKYGCSNTSKWDSFDGTREQLVELAENWIKDIILNNVNNENKQEKQILSEKIIQEPMAITHTNRGR